MSFAARLVHRLAIVVPTGGDPEDPDDLDDRGHVIATEPTVELVRGLIQPRRTEELAAISQGGLELSDHVIFLLPRAIPEGAWIADADAAGIRTGGRRFDVVGVRAFDFGRSPHLEVDVKLAGRSEPPAFG